MAYAMNAVVVRLCLRIDKCFPEVRAFVESKGYSGFAVREVAGEDNEHWHWYLEGGPYPNVQRFRVQLTRSVPELRGNRAYAAKEASQDTYEQYWKYCCKGTSEANAPEISWRHGLLWTDAKFTELHAAYWAANPRAAARRARPARDIVLERCREARVEWDDRREIFKHYINVLFEQNKPINLFMVRTHVNLLQLQLAPNREDAVELLLNQVPLI